MSRGADQPFSAKLNRFFGSKTGAFSPVTRTEAKDGQITLTGAEKAIAIEYFGVEELAPFRGNDDTLAALGLDARREFRVFPDGNRVFPKLKYAKASGSELRLYFNEGEFKAPSGNFWGIFVKDNFIWLCDFSPWWYEDVIGGQTNSLNFSVPLEPEVDDYQSLANEALPAQVETTGKSWKRNPKLASLAFQENGYRCEVRPEIETFISKSTGKPFLEAHHLVPMKAQASFADISLDNQENICVLSPFVHRKLHHAPFELIEEDIKQLAQARQSFLDRLEVSMDFLFSAYGSARQKGN